MKNNTGTLVATLALALTLAGCSTPIQNPTNISTPFQATVVGAAAGAMVGAPFGGVGAPIGAFAGAVAGGTAGAIEELFSGRTNNVTPGSYRPIYFGKNSAVVLPMYRTELNNASTTLIHHPDMLVTLGGYTDYVGHERNHNTLAYARAYAVAYELECRGVPKDQIRVVSYGSYTGSLANAQDNVNRQLSRKVTVYLHPKNDVRYQSTYAPMPGQNGKS